MSESAADQSLVIMDRKFEGADRRSDYKFRGLTQEELRRRREETSVMLRQKAREDSLNKRRNIVENPHINADPRQPSIPISPVSSSDNVIMAFNAVCRISSRWPVVFILTISVSSWRASRASGSICPRSTILRSRRSLTAAWSLASSSCSPASSTLPRMCRRRLCLRRRGP